VTQALRPRFFAGNAQEWIAMTDSRHDRRRLLPPRVIPLIYYGIARAALLTALVAAASDPVPIAAFFYHTRMLALVHLVTLGWLTCSILGSLYIVGPFALRIAMPAGAIDYVACALAGAGVSGVVAGFWWNHPSSVGWSGALVVVAVLIVGARTLAALRSAPVQRAVTLHVSLAFLNFLLAAAAGIAIAFDKTYHVLPGSLLANVFAHAHLAAIGWVGMMAVGIGYRLFPMVLPAAMPQGRALYLSAVLLEAGTLLLASGLAYRARAVSFSGAVAVACGFAAFLVQVRGMLRARRPPPAALPSPDFGRWQSLTAVLYLILSMTIGFVLVTATLSEWTLRIAAAYGVVGLIGFYSQLVAGMEYRLLPYYAWYWAFANTDFKGPAPGPHEMPLPGVQAAAFVLWLAGVPLLALGLLMIRPLAVAGGASLLAGAVVLGGADAIAIARHAFRGR
jgi:hypothetical protein